ncbi:MAG: hypothetical protein HRT45_07455 [Bdellovibrionales bacterium]|nr:hypothetical protein [Bdellovibrionales bacterium]
MKPVLFFVFILNLLFALDAGASMCAIESAALQGEASSVRNFMRRDRFPRAADVSKNDPHLRQALFLVFNGMDYYNPNVELKMDAFEVDHIWPVDRGGPDNIFNYAPTTKAFNIWKSNNYDAASTNFFLADVRVHYARKVYRLYQELKSGARASSVSPAMVEAVQTQIAKLEGLDADQRRLLRVAILDKYDGRKNELLLFSQAIVDYVARLPRKQRAQIKLGGG